MSKPMNQLITTSFRKWCYNLSGFNQFGLWRDDFHDSDDPIVKEALKRISQNVIDERNFRITRALQLDAQHKVLPKEEWTKFEEDKLYLTPHINNVKVEHEERKQWEKS